MNFLYSVIKRYFRESDIFHEGMENRALFYLVSGGVGGAITNTVYFGFQQTLAGSFGFGMFLGLCIGLVMYIFPLFTYQEQVNKLSHARVRLIVWTINIIVVANLFLPMLYQIYIVGDK